MSPSPSILWLLGLLIWAGENNPANFLGAELRSLEVQVINEKEMLLQTPEHYKY